MVLSAFVLGLGLSVGNIKGATVQCVCVYVKDVRVGVTSDARALPLFKVN